MAKEQKQLDDLFHDSLKDIYFAEKKILAALPKMAKAAQSEELTAAFQKHERETEGQVQRLEQVFAVIERHRAERIAQPSSASSKRGRKSWMITRAHLRSTQVSCLRLNPSSTMKSRATAP
jgi:hypothetical protein